MLTNWSRLASLIAALATVAAGAGAASAMDTMSSSASCDTMHSQIAATHEKIVSMKSTGDPDKDYMAAMPMMAKAMMQMNAYEMKCGKTAATKKMAASSQKNFDALYHLFDGINSIPGN